MQEIRNFLFFYLAVSLLDVFFLDKFMFQKGFCITHKRLKPNPVATEGLWWA